MRIKKQLLTHLGVTSARADKYLPDLNRTLPDHQIDSPLRIVHFLAQVLHESALMRFVQENLNRSFRDNYQFWPRALNRRGFSYL